jgi:hypothetical protein
MSCAGIYVRLLSSSGGLLNAETHYTYSDEVVKFDERLFAAVVGTFISYKCRVTDVSRALIL